MHNRLAGAIGDRDGIGRHLMQMVVCIGPMIEGGRRNWSLTALVRLLIHAC